MAALTVDEIGDATGCWGCFPDKWAATLYLLNQIRLGGGGDVMTNDEIATAAACFTCFPDKEAVALYLLDQIAASGTGGGGVACGDTDPVAPPDDPAKCSAYYQRTSKVVWWWNSATQVWE